jgi:hypothetical protein
VKPWKLQKFAADVVYDLRSRNLLLPVVALLVAIVAVPILLKSNSSSEPVPSLGVASSSTVAGPGDSAVVAYRPGVRNYKQRLKNLAAKDPFRSQFTKPAPSSGSGSDSLADALGGSSTGGGSTGVGGGSTGSGGSDAGGGGKGGGKSPGKVVKQKTTYFWWQSDVQVGESGTQLATMNNVKPFQFLPSPELPVLTYIGTVSGNQAVFLVSKDVQSIGGEGTCFPSVDACQLLGLNAGKGADLIYGPDGKTYHVQVLRVKRVTSSKPPNF